MTDTPSTTAAQRADLRLGLLLGIGAYTLWGLFPLYFPLLEPATPLEVLAHRFVWSFVFLALIMTVTRSWSRMHDVVRNRRVMLMLIAATVLISINWGTYIWAVNNDHVVEASLGYFINPLVVVLTGTLLLGERLRPMQWTAVGIAAVAVAVLTLGYGAVPWVALALAFSWAGYGLVKKLAGVDPVASLAVETAYGTPFALAYILVLQAQGALAFGHASPGNTLLLMMTGVVTAIPLVLFGAATNRVPLSTIGVLQYLTPSLQFLLGVTVFGEQMPPARWVGFGIVWLALVVFTWDSLRAGSASRAARRAEEDGVHEGVTEPA
ncbi:MAG: EamA family transporter RarD [Candidatus Nanopelagicales bacterium]